MLNRIREDVRTVFAKDPAARTPWEVLCCYPGLHAIWFHRLAHVLWRRGFRFLARAVSHLSRWLTGVEIHPGANIGRRFFIDHGMGVVIGETAEIGDDVLMYQGVVLGGTSTEKIKRHPTIGKGVVIGANATILGPISVGDGARIGAGSVVVKSVPPGTTVVGVPGHIAGLTSSTASETDLLQHGHLPDPVLRTLGEILERQSRLEEKVGDLESALPNAGRPHVVGSDRVSNGAVRGEQDILHALRDVIDPEVGINIVDLGLVREIKRNGGGMEIRMVLTSPSHPMAGYLVEQVRRKVRQAVNGGAVEVVLLDEPWRWEDRTPHLRSGGGI
ncbi:MAG: serine O-acetyltransferase [Anaerolineae bacterium]|jgi:serine O-acetyltransferase